MNKFTNKIVVGWAHRQKLGLPREKRSFIMHRAGHFCHSKGNVKHASFYMQRAWYFAYTRCSFLSRTKDVFCI